MCVAESLAADPLVCVNCGAMVDPSCRGHKKYCQACRKAIQDQRSRECHLKRRTERSGRGECTQCGIPRQNDTEVPLTVFLENIDPRLVNIITEEQVQEAKLCRHCYAIYRLRMLEIRLNRPVKTKPIPMTPDEQKERMKLLNKERRERLLQMNPKLCHHCLKREIEEGKTWCTFCLDRGVAANRKKIERRRVAQKCVICEKPTGGKQLCEECKVIQKRYSKKWWDRIKIERQEKHICLRCGHATQLPGKKSCEECAAKSRQYIKTRRSNGMCQRCGRIPPLHGRVMCEECAAKTREYMNRRYPIKQQEKQ